MKRLLLLISALAVGFLSSNAQDEYFGLVQTPGTTYIIESNGAGYIFTGGWGTGFRFSTNKAVSFSAPTGGNPGLFITDIFTNGSEVIVTSNDQGVSISANNGTSFNNINGDLPGDVIPTTVVRSGSRLVIGTAGHGFFYSDDEGTTWTNVNENLRYWDIKDLATADAGQIIAATYGGGLYRTTDNGESWVEANAISNSVASKYINDLYTYGTTGDVYAATNNDGVYLTGDGGFSWARIDTVGLTDASLDVTGIAVMTINSERYPIASFRESGVYYYDYLFRQSWYKDSGIQEGFTDITVDEDGDVYAISSANGVYYSDDDGQFWDPRDRDGHQRELNIVPVSTGDYYLHVPGTPLVVRVDNYGETAVPLTPSTSVIKNIIYHKNKLYAMRDSSIAVYDGTIWQTLADYNQMLGDSFFVFDTWVITPNDKIVGTYNSVTGGVGPNGEDEQRLYIFDYNLITDVFDNNQLMLTSAEAGPLRKRKIVSDNGSNVMLVTLPQGVLYRPNGQTTWTDKGNTLPALLSFTDVNDLDFAFNRFFLSSSRGLLTSTNAGDSWSVDSFGITNANTKQFLAISSNAWMVGLDEDHGLLYSTNQGMSWTPRNESIYVGETKGLEMSSDGDVYYFNNYLFLRPNPAILNAPQAISPPNDAVGIELEPVDMEWSETVSPLYQIQVATDEQFGGLLEEFVLAPEMITADIPNLQYNTTYYWRVRSKYYGSYSLYNTNTFTTKLQAPELVTPIDLRVGFALDGMLEWKPTDGADTYVIEISEDSTFASVAQSFPAVADTIVMADGLKNLTTYYWRAKAENSKGNFSDWSSTGSFVSILSPPLLVSPSNGENKVTVNVIFNWDDVTSAKEYTLQVSKSSDFSADTETVNNIPDSENQVGFLEFQTQYYWRVAAVDSMDNSSEWSEVWSFTTGLPAVELVSPSNNLFNTEYELKLVWNGLDIAQEYDLEVSLNPDMSSPFVSENGTSNLSYDIAGLEPYTTYYWRIRGNSNGEKGTWSQIWSFRTRMTGLTLLTPTDEERLSVNSTTLTWDRPEGVTQYDILVTNDPGQQDTLYSFTSRTDNRLSVNGLSDGTYYWMVRGYNEDRTSSTGWTDVWEFEVVTSSVELNDESLTLSPNPASNVALINWDGTIRYSSISIVDATGRLMSVLEGDKLQSGQATINLEGWTRGTYFLILESPSGTVYRRLSVR
ncbi:MAG: hypothetical protein Kapaf2KO_03600 [Candidatus Kapaibacteriales bacterium]